MSIPERDMVQIFSPYRADQSFDKGMRQRNMRNSLHLRHFENPEIGDPLAVAEERVIVRAQVSWTPGSINDAVEHTPYVWPIRRTCMNGKTDDPPGKLIHDDHDPM